MLDVQESTMTRQYDKNAELLEKGNLGETNFGLQILQFGAEREAGKAVGR